MIYFPQLLSGTLSQYPLAKRWLKRTISNESPDGRFVKLPDPGANLVEWVLSYSGLTRFEVNQLDELFRKVEGRLRDFVFADPAGNLLAWSGQFDQQVWQKSPTLVVTMLADGPSSGLKAARVVNTGSGPARLEQRVNAPAWFHYCFSVLARAEGGQALKLFRSAGGREEVKTVSGSSSWRQHVLSGRFDGLTEEALNVGIELAGGASVELAAAQLEAQPAWSGYKGTQAQGGVYQSARFNQDQFTVTADGPTEHSCTLRIVAQTER